jgi:hypothetical protein
MRRCGFAVAVLLLSFSVSGWANNNFVVPTTTLSAQTGNNTSAANNFHTLSDGNLGANNVSKVDVHSLLYASATTKIYAHLLLWWGESGHIDIGYSSTDPNQIRRQVTDMVSRGIDGVIIDWYGPGNSIDQGTQLVMAEAEKHPGFTFAIMVDQGAIEWDSCSGCTPQQALIRQLQYVEETYVPSPAYMKIDGLPVITNFNLDLSYSIDWNAVNAELSTHPKFIFQNNPGFTHTLSDGSYSWVMPTTSDYGMSYLNSFYDTGMSYPAEETVGATYKGFNDTLASWGSNRIMDQQCGQTWLKTFAKLNSLYNSGHQLPDLQLVTWNDYEEGTEIESGIDNCVSVSASVSGNGLQWKIGGSESTIDHYTIYISTDGQNLMALEEEAPGNSSLNLCSFSVPAGNYTLFVQAVGRPTMANKITGPINYTSTCASANPTPTPTPTPKPTPSPTPTPTPAVMSLTASPATQSLPAGQQAKFMITAAVQSGTFSNPIALSCGNLPSFLSCAFSPNSVTPNSASANSTLTLTAASNTGAQLRDRRLRLAYGLWLFPFGLVGLVTSGRPGGFRRSVSIRMLAIVCAIGMTMTVIACTGISQSANIAASVPKASNYSVMVNGTSGNTQISTVVTVSVP